ncbi:MAG: hypothetical protein Ct9H300mP5_3170 [Candidatus Pelagibacterales bacterium]|nr:MAG: hypothetical protein Ct9H300mP5_3170 [Pelagibacterales bacterium]
MLKEKLNIEPEPPLDDRFFMVYQCQKTYGITRIFSEKSYSGQAFSSVEDFKNL